MKFLLFLIFLLVLIGYTGMIIGWSALIAAIFLFIFYKEIAIIVGLAVVVWLVFNTSRKMS